MDTVPTVLLADDDVDVVDAIASILEASFGRARLRVLIAHDGVEALELLAAERPHVLVLDLNMPRLDGVEVLTRMAACASLAEVRVILMSGDPAAEQVARAFGVAACLPKDGAVAPLLKTVSATLGERQPPAPG